MTGGRPPLLVIDASVSLKWALDDEEAVEQAVALRDDALGGRYRLIAPSLWLYEVTNALVTAVRRRRLEERRGEQMLGLLLELGVRLVDPTASVVYSRANRHRIAAYDAAYVALAEELEVALWTGDWRLYTALRGAAARVEWIGSYQAAASE